MKIIDFARKGNVMRFYLGADDLTDWHGDDWNDRPYEYNAGQVYDRFIAGHRDIVFPFDTAVLEPCCGVLNSEWSKDDMKARRVPCVIVVPQAVLQDHWSSEDFNEFIGDDRVRRVYFGDPLEPEPEALPPELINVIQLHHTSRK